MQTVLPDSSQDATHRKQCLTHRSFNFPRKLKAATSDSVLHSSGLPLRAGPLHHFTFADSLNTPKFQRARDLGGSYSK